MTCSITLVNSHLSSNHRFCFLRRNFCQVHLVFDWKADSVASDANCSRIGSQDSSKHELEYGSFTDVSKPHAAINLSSSFVIGCWPAEFSFLTVGIGLVHCFHCLGYSGSKQASSFG